MDTPASAAIASMLVRLYPSRPKTVRAPWVMARRFPARTPGRPVPGVRDAASASGSAGAVGVVFREASG
uniref:Uncharacterized protein n=1 Tax=Streptomyces sp. NBC_00008 TaxID=2903610 RepID=A0AAU2VP43_9ACTN